MLSDTFHMLSYAFEFERFESFLLKKGTDYYGHCIDRADSGGYRLITRRHERGSPD